jgi:hypothetical protein
VQCLGQFRLAFANLTFALGRVRRSRLEQAGHLHRLVTRVGVAGLRRFRPRIGQQAGELLGHAGGRRQLVANGVQARPDLNQAALLRRQIHTERLDLRLAAVRFFDRYAQLADFGNQRRE